MFPTHTELDLYFLVARHCVKFGEDRLRIVVSRAVK
jgi:hypothetical protein